MKYFITINQIGIASAGLAGKTDLIDWAIIDYLSQWYFSERKKTIFIQDEGINFVWVNYRHLIEEMPLIGISDKDALTHRFKKLKRLGLIQTFQAKDNSLYFILSPKCIEIIGFSKSSDRVSDGNGTGCPMGIGQGVSDGNRTAQTIYHSNNGPIKEREDVLSPQKRNAFKKPTLEEVTGYCLERRNNVKPDVWFDFYESKGWLIGKTPMKDWKAAVRTWERRPQENNGSNNNKWRTYEREIPAESDECLRQAREALKKITADKSRQGNTRGSGSA